MIRLGFLSALVLAFMGCAPPTPPVDQSLMIEGQMKIVKSIQIAAPPVPIGQPPAEVLAKLVAATAEADSLTAGQKFRCRGEGFWIVGLKESNTYLISDDGYACAVASWAEIVKPMLLGEGMRQVGSAQIPPQYRGFEELSSILTSMMIVDAGFRGCARQLVVEIDSAQTPERRDALKRVARALLREGVEMKCRLETVSLGKICVQLSPEERRQLARVAI